MVEEWKLSHKTRDAFVFVSLLCQNDKTKEPSRRPAYTQWMKTLPFVSPHINRRFLLLTKFQEFCYGLHKITARCRFHITTLRIILMSPGQSFRGLFSRGYRSWLSVRLSLLTSTECLAKSGTAPKYSAKIFYWFAVSPYWWVSTAYFWELRSCSHYKPRLF